MKDTFHVYKHSGGPEDGIQGDDGLRSDRGFSSVQEASEVTRELFPALYLVMLRGRYSGAIVAIRRPGHGRWMFLTDETDVSSDCKAAGR